MPVMNIASFATDLPHWYRKHCWEGRYHSKRGYPPDCHANAFPWMTVLENRLSLKASKGQGLDVDDLVEIAEWGGGQHGLAAQLRRHNTEEGIREATAHASAHLDNPAEALRDLREGISHWGLTYASKTLMFMRPEHHAALDARLRRGLGSLLPRIYEGPAPYQINSQIEGYLAFLKICRDLQHRVQSPGPRNNGEWFLVDVETALFAFVSEDGQLVLK